VGSGLAVSMRTVDLHEVVSRAVEELRLAFPNHTILHRSAGPGDCFADPDRLAQLVGNLVSNAAAYGLSTAPITVATTVRDGRATLRVHNEGQPIPTEALDRIFEPMARGVPGSSRVRSVGLGLYIVREIARAHGGTIEVRSSLADGTEFSFNFQVNEEVHEPKA
jgi:sigma-B regulation protein RsbU (phosphoserine phosphatase)